MYYAISFYISNSYSVKLRKAASEAEFGENRENLENLLHFFANFFKL